MSNYKKYLNKFGYISEYKTYPVYNYQRRVWSDILNRDVDEDIFQHTMDEINKDFKKHVEENIMNQMFIDEIKFDTFTQTTCSKPSELNVGSVDNLIKSLKEYDKQRKQVLLSVKEDVNKLFEKYKIICSEFVKDGNMFVIPAGGLFDENKREKLVMSGKDYYNILQLKHECDKIE